MEEKLREWKIGEKDEIELEEEMEVTEPPAKLTITEMLKRKMRAEKERSSGLSAIFSNSSASTSTVSRFRKECLSYEELPDASSDVEQLQWWKNHQEQFRLLSHMISRLRCPCGQQQVLEGLQRGGQDRDGPAGLHGPGEGRGRGHS